MIIKYPLFLQYLNGVYVQRHNHNRKIDDPLFRSRYKAILVDTGLYRLRLLRYIHLNPVAAKIVNCPSTYEWSSYNAYVNEEIKNNWLHTSYLIRTINNIESISSFSSFHEAGIDPEIYAFYNNKKIKPIFGSDDFVSMIKHNNLIYNTPDP